MNLCSSGSKFYRIYIRCVWQSCVCYLRYTVQHIQHVQHALQLPCPIYWLHKPDVALVPIIPFVHSVCNVQCGDKRVVTAAAGVDLNNTLSPQGHITLWRLLTREAGKLEQEKCLRPCVMRKSKGQEKKAWWCDMYYSTKLTDASIHLILRNVVKYYCWNTNVPRLGLVFAVP